jgi:hypothetical protein
MAVSQKQEAQKFLEAVDVEVVFKLVNNGTLKDLNELAEALNTGVGCQ